MDFNNFCKFHFSKTMNSDDQTYMDKYKNNKFSKKVNYNIH